MKTKTLHNLAKPTKWLWPIVVATGLLFASAALADVPVPYVTDLTADGGEDGLQVNVGDVSVYNDATNLSVSYLIDDAVTFPLVDDSQVGKWCITGTHTDVQTEAALIPQTKKHLPIPGIFAYYDTDDYECESSATQLIPNSWAWASEEEKELFIAAHANVQQLVSVETNLPGFEAALPDQVSMKIAYPYADSYFSTTIFNDGDLNGTYDAWCIDVGHTISVGVTYTANVYSSYETIPPGDIDDPNIDNPENLDLVNYIANTYAVGDPSPIVTLGTYTMCDIQRAIWTVIDDSVTSCGTYNQYRVDEIVADALLNGVSYVPECGGFVAVVLIPVNGQQYTIAQVTTIQVGAQCVATWEGETAWGGYYPSYDDREITFGGKSWAIYFSYILDKDYSLVE